MWRVSQARRFSVIDVIYIGAGRQDVSQQEFTDVLRSILEVTAVTGLYW